MKRVSFTICMIMITWSATGQDLTAGGSVMGEVLFSLPEWGKPAAENRAGSTLSGTLFFAYNPSHAMRARAELNYRYSTGYMHPLGRYEATGLPPVVDQGLFPGTDYRQEFRIGQLWAETHRGDFFITLGKFPLGWGSCWFMNPSDRSIPSASSAIVSDETVDGLPGFSVEWAPPGAVGINAYAFVQDTGGSGMVEMEDGNPMNLPAGFKVQFLLETVEFSAGLAREVWKTADSWARPLYFIADVNVPAGAFMVYAETAFRFPLNDAGTGWNSGETDFAGSLVAASGVSGHIERAQADVLFEYHYLGTGGSPGSYDPVPVLEGRGFLMGRHYLLARLSRELFTGLNMNITDLVNAADRSGLLVLEICWEPDMDNSLELSFLVPRGGYRSEMGGRAELVPGVLYWRIWDAMSVSLGYTLYF